MPGSHCSCSELAIFNEPRCVPLLDDHVENSDAHEAIERVFTWRQFRSWHFVQENSKEYWKSIPMTSIPFHILILCCTKMCGLRCHRRYILSSQNCGFNSHVCMCELQFLLNVCSTWVSETSLGNVVCCTCVSRKRRVFDLNLWNVSWKRRLLDMRLWNVQYACKRRHDIKEQTKGTSVLSGPVSLCRHADWLVSFDTNKVRHTKCTIMCPVPVPLYLRGF